MDEKIAVLTDTNSGITPEQAARYGIYLVAMPVIIDDETYFENESIFQEDFFQRLREGACVSTSQPAPGVLMDCWEGLLERYDEIIYLPMSSGLSGSCQTAATRRAEFQSWETRSNGTHHFSGAGRHCRSRYRLIGFS